MLELALEEAGVAPTVISTPDSLRGAAPDHQALQENIFSRTIESLYDKGLDSPAVTYNLNQLATGLSP